MSRAHDIEWTSGDYYLEYGSVCLNIMNSTLVAQPYENLGHVGADMAVVDTRVVPVGCGHIYHIQLITWQNYSTR